MRKFCYTNKTQKEKSMARIIVITSGKGGVGKSSLSVIVGRELAKRKKKVVLIDTDVGLNNLDVIMDVEKRVVYDIGDVLGARCRLAQALTVDSEEENLYLLPSIKGYNDSLTSVGLKKITTALSIKFDYVLIDCPAGIDEGFHRAVSCANEAIVVTTPHLSAIKDASTVIKLLSSYKLNRVSYALNRVRGDMIVNLQMADVDDITKALGLSPIGVIPESDEINSLSSVGNMLDENGLSAKAISLLCENIENGTDKILDFTKKYRGFLGTIRRAIKTRI